MESTVAPGPEGGASVVRGVPMAGDGVTTVAPEVRETPFFNVFTA